MKSIEKISENKILENVKNELSEYKRNISRITRYLQDN
jgi:hypothetical protein